MPDVSGFIDREVNGVEPWKVVDLIVHYRVPDSQSNRSKKFTLDRDAIEAEHISQYRKQWDEVPEEHREKLEGRPTPEEFEATYSIPDFERAVLDEAQRLLHEPILEKGSATNHFRILPATSIYEVEIRVRNKGGVALPN